MDAFQNFDLAFAARAVGMRMTVLGKHPVWKSTIRQCVLLRIATWRRTRH